MTQEDYDEKEIVVTLIVTGMLEVRKEIEDMKKEIEREFVLKDYKQPVVRKEAELIMPSFLQEVGGKRRIL